MPNHVRQKLTVAGTANDVAAFIATARGASPVTGDEGPLFVDGSPARERRLRIEPLNFHLIAPLSDDYSRLPYESYGYKAEITGWGVEWGPYKIAADAPSVSPDGSSATYEFTCAWGPPLKALVRASLRYPMLGFALSWGGEGPCRGRHLFRAGAMLAVADDPYDPIIKIDMPTDAEYAADENAAHEKRVATECWYIARHDLWVQSLLTGAAT